VLSTVRNFVMGLMLLIGTHAYANSDSIKTKQDAMIAIGLETANLNSILSLLCMNYMGVEYNNPHQRIQAIAKHYDETLEAMHKGFESPDIRQNIDNLKAQWARSKDKILAQFNNNTSQKIDARSVYDSIQTNLAELKKTQALFLEGFQTNHIADVNAAIEIGASAKQLSSLYLIKLCKLDNPTYDELWLKAVHRFQTGIATLKQSSLMHDKTFTTALTASEKHLHFFEMMKKMSRGAPVAIDKRSDQVLRLSTQMLKTILETK